MLISGSSSTISKNIPIESANLTKLNDLFVTQKDILLKYFNISITSMSSNENYILKLNNFLEEFNALFSKINSSIADLTLLMNKLKALEAGVNNDSDNLSFLINDYNDFYISAYPSLIDCIGFITNLIEELFINPDYNKSIENRKKIFSDLLSSIESEKESKKDLEKSVQRNKILDEFLTNSNKENIQDIANKLAEEIETSQKSEQITNSENLYNLQDDTTTQNTSLATDKKISKFVSSIDNENVSANIPTIDESSKTNRITKLPLQDNDTLIISENDGFVYLPFKVENLKQEFLEKNKKYSGLVDLINSEYIIPINKYKNSVTSRFKEAYLLMVNKEKGSALSGLELGLELAFNYSLHPAIISACKNLDELDLYLLALESKDLSSFKAFKISFESVPKK